MNLDQGTVDADLAEAIARVDAAVSAMRQGDPEPCIACLAERDDVTLFGAWGPIERGHDSLVETWRWVAGRFTGGRADVEHAVVAQSGDLAYTVGFERGPASVVGEPEREMVIRVTHIYRRDEDGWKLVHRHGDFAPPDQRQVTG